MILLKKLSKDLGININDLQNILIKENIKIERVPKTGNPVYQVLFKDEKEYLEFYKKYAVINPDRAMAVSEIEELTERKWEELQEDLLKNNYEFKNIIKNGTEYIQFRTRRMKENIIKFKKINKEKAIKHSELINLTEKRPGTLRALLKKHNLQTRMIKYKGEEYIQFSTKEDLEFFLDKYSLLDPDMYDRETGKKKIPDRIKFKLMFAS